MSRPRFQKAGIEFLARKDKPLHSLVRRFLEYIDFPMDRHYYTLANCNIHGRVIIDGTKALTRINVYGNILTTTRKKP